MLTRLPLRRKLYVNQDRKKTEEQLRKVANAGYKAICVTVDAPVAGKRERYTLVRLSLVDFVG